MPKIYGPYKRKDGRKHVVLVYHNRDGSVKRKTTMSYPKFLVEKKLGRRLKKGETVDHIDGNFKNDAWSNLRVVSHNKHAREDADYAFPHKIICVWCGSGVYKRRGNLRGNSKKGKAGPFCSKSCAGKYSASVQNGGPKLPVQPSPELTYYKIKKEGGLGDQGK